ncbi:dephospho-CoA kinase [Joostella atrarenae]|uniref:Dephospho-CoA kinase n=1 Tax=Joostella atrarenae TaxID=679257 RepID=A0ABS9J2G5_9FLAO|nr:dephospho-CoA kinase [Joostella atrarenae]MCF8714607.1 dephospho-CoA kinase [Joostella atrarenae]
MIVGLTGGIGSGKSTVASLFKKLDVPVFIADVEAKSLMETNNDVRKRIIDLFGENAYDHNLPNRKYIADIVFADPEKLKKLNAIIHPAVGAHFKDWYENQEAAYVIKEVAILFETGGDKQCDLVITVTAPKEVRLQRVLKRDNTTREEVEARMNNQWKEEDKVKKSDFVIENIDLEETSQIVEKIHEMILKKSI